MKSQLRRRKKNNCGGYITSDDGATTLTILKLLDDKGNVKVEMRDVSGKVRFNRCPMCGRCFG